ncbi:hypothetical protein LHV13_03960 [Ferrovum sp. PN-J185]|uniref:hypothetical protein n=1 Tax=Ferrovum sp. PN-J185 TaxID=1356306 RepID=UPI001E2D0644|nr:hypothetical protein [Ferrovum sp. PN-J185]MCC6068332.1 hypothetical protein [Ferrovum sp. PN-J185]
MSTRLGECQGKAKAAQAAAKKHQTTVRPKIKPTQFVKKPIAPIKPIPAVAKAQTTPAPQQAKLPNSLKPLPTSVLNPINGNLPTPNDLDKNQSAS